MQTFEQPSNPLEYGGPMTDEPLRPAWKTGYLRTVFWCWLVPLAIGVLAFLGFCITPRDAQVVFGLFGFMNLYLGVFLSAIGLLMIIIFAANRWSRTGRKWEDIIRPAGAAVLLLGSNYLVAALIILIAISMFR